MVTFKLYERKDKPTAKGIPIIFIISYNNETPKISTGEHCKKNSWKQEAQSVDSRKDVDGPKINARLNEHKLALRNILDAQEDFDINEVRELFNEYLEKRKELKEEGKVFNAKAALQAKRVVNTAKAGENNDDLIKRTWKKEHLNKFNKCTPIGKEFFMTIERIIYDHETTWARGYKKRFRTICTKFLSFEPNFKPTTLTEKWWLRFATYCINKLENVSNTINTDTKTIKALIKELRKEGFAFESGLEEKIEWKYIEPEVLGLSWDKVIKISKMNLINHPKKTLEASRILWVVAAFTGRRWEEVLEIKQGNFYQKDKKWRYRNIGKGQKRVDFLLLPEAIVFLKKIGLIGGKTELPQLAGQTVNEDIKTICKIAKFKDPIHVITPIDKSRVLKETLEEHETVHFHTARHSYGQHIAELAAGMAYAQQWIAHMLGHASYQTSWKYMNRAKSSHDKMFDEVMIFNQALQNAA